MESSQRPWSPPQIQRTKETRNWKPWVIGFVGLCLVLLLGFWAFAKTITLDIDGRKTTYVTFRTTVGDFLIHSKLGIHSEDYVFPGRNSLLRNGITIAVRRSEAVTLTVDGRKFSFRTLSLLVGDAVNEANSKYSLGLKASDEVEPGRNTVVHADTIVSVERSVPVKLIIGGKDTQIETAPKSVRQVLSKQNITVGANDLVTPGLDELVTANASIKVIRVAEKLVTQQNELPYQIVTKSGDFPVGLPDRVLTKGVSGLEQKTIKITYQDGVEVKRETINQSIVHKPVNQVIARGAQTSVSRGGQVVNFKRAILVTATGYYQPGGITSVGSGVRRGVVAVDPGVIKYYSHIWIDGYGWGTALDTGSAIQGNRIDLYFESEAEAIAWGVRKVMVYIL